MKNAPQEETQGNEGPMQAQGEQPEGTNEIASAESDGTLDDDALDDEEPGEGGGTIEDLLAMLGGGGTGPSAGEPEEHVCESCAGIKPRAVDIVQSIVPPLLDAAQAARLVGNEALGREIAGQTVAVLVIRNLMPRATTFMETIVIARDAGAVAKVVMPGFKEHAFALYMNNDASCPDFDALVPATVDEAILARATEIVESVSPGLLDAMVAAKAREDALTAEEKSAHHSPLSTEHFSQQIVGELLPRMMIMVGNEDILSTYSAAGRGVFEKFFQVHADQPIIAASLKAKAEREAAEADEDEGTENNGPVVIE